MKVRKQAWLEVRGVSQETGDRRGGSMYPPGVKFEVGNGKGEKTG